VEKWSDFTGSWLENGTWTRIEVYENTGLDPLYDPDNPDYIEAMKEVESFLRREQG